MLWYAAPLASSSCVVIEYRVPLDVFEPVLPEVFYLTIFHNAGHKVAFIGLGRDCSIAGFTPWLAAPYCAASFYFGFLDGG